MKVEVISKEDAMEDFARSPVKGAWIQIINAVKEDGKPRKVSGLTRGQVAAANRKAKESGVRCKTNYKGGYVVLVAELEAED